MQCAIPPKPHDIESFVESVYRSHGFRAPEDVSLLVWNDIADIRVVYRSGPSSVRQMGDTYFVLVDIGLPLPNRRAVVAHEIGHVVLHSGSQLWTTDVLRGQQERQARRFACSALMPKYLISPMIKRRRESDGQAFADELADAFCVPTQMVYERFSTLSEGGSD